MVQVPTGVVLTIPGWMFDPSACSNMATGTPRVTVTALVELTQLLMDTANRAQFPGDVGFAQEEANEISQIAENGLKRETRITIVEGRARKSHKRGKPIGTWEVMIRDHHEGYIDWEEFERNQKQLALNNYGHAEGIKSGRGGGALLAGIMLCRRCGQRLSVAYTGNPQSRPVYQCQKSQLAGRRRCMSFGGSRVDTAVAHELLRAVEPMAIDAAFEAERMHRERQESQQHIRDLEMQQARYEAGLAERRYAACDPDNRLIASQLEKSWENALRRIRDLENQQPWESPLDIKVEPDAFINLSENLSAAWSAPTVTTRARQQLLRALVTDIIADVDDEARDVILTIHWRGGQHSELRVRKPRTGEHGCATSEDALAVMRSMAGRWSDEHIAASLNRMGMPTGQGKTWTAKRVSSVRRVRNIHAYRSAEKDGEWLTMQETARALGVTSHAVRRLVKTGVLPAEQVIPGAPYQIRADDLTLASVKAAVARKGSPCRASDTGTLPMFTDT
jgi:excisionase family DNA binding protein